MNPNPIAPLTRLVHDVKYLFTAPFILGLLAVIDWMTSPGHWWVQWAALGMGIAWVICLFRVLKAMIILGGLAALIAFLRRH